MSVRQLPRGRVSRTALYAVVGVLSVFAVFPLFWMAVTALKRFDAIYTFPPPLLPLPPTLDQFAPLFPAPNLFLRLLLNSALVTLGSTAITTVLATMAGFGLARGRFRVRRLLLRATLFAYVFPPILLVIPLFVVIAGVGLANTYPGLIAAYVVMTLPFATWLMRAYFVNLPGELLEAAIVDGASNFRAFWSIALPLARPGIAAITIFTFINAWNEFLFAYVIVGGGESRTIAVGLNTLLHGAEGAEYGLLMAGSTIAVLPILVLFVIAQRQIVTGLTAGAVKG